MDIPTNLELTGMWFFPDALEKKYLGILKYKPFEGECYLTIYGVALVEQTKIACVFGETTSGKKVTLFDSTVSGNSKSIVGDDLSSYTVLSYLTFLIGNDFFASKGEVCFQSLSFRCSNLAEWIGYFPFQSTVDAGTKGFIFNKKHPITIYSDERVSIQILFHFDSDTSPFEINMKYCPKILVKAKSNRKIPYWGKENSLSYYMRLISSFLEFVIGRNAIPYRLCGFEQRRVRFPSNIVQITNKKTCLDIHETFIYWSCKQEKEWFTPLHKDRILLPFSFVKDHIKSFVGSFFENYDLFDDILGDWVTTRNSSSYSNHTLPILLYDIEGLHTSLFPNFRPAGTKSDINIPYCCRLRDIFFNCLSGFFPFITSEQFDVIIKDLVKIRKADAHAKRIKEIPLLSDPAWREYRFFLIFLAEFAICFLILKRTCQVKKTFISRFALGWDDLQKRLPALINERMKSLQ